MIIVWISKLMIGRRDGRAPREAKSGGMSYGKSGEPWAIGRPIRKHSDMYLFEFPLRDHFFAPSRRESALSLVINHASGVAPGILT